MISPSPFMFRKSLAPQQLGRKSLGLSNADMRSLLISKADLWTELAKDQAWGPLRDDIEDTYRSLGLGNDSSNSADNLVHSLRGFFSRSPERIGYEVHDRIGNIINNFEIRGWHKSLGKRGLGQKSFMTSQEAAAYIRSKERLFVALAVDGMWDILRDAVTETLEEVGYTPSIIATKATEFVHELRRWGERYGRDYNSYDDRVSRLCAELNSSLRLQENLRNQKTLSAFNNNLGGALVASPVFAGRKPIAPSPFRKRVMKGKV